MGPSEAKALLVLLDLVNTFITMSNEPIVDANGNVLAKNLSDYKAQSNVEIFKEHFKNKSPDDISREIDKFITKESTE